MGLFFEVLSAINNPMQKASIEQLAGFTNGIQQLSKNNGIDPGNMQTVISTIGGLLRPVLKQQKMTLGNQNLDALLGQVMGAGGLGSLTSFITPQLQQQIIGVIAEKTGISSSNLQSIVSDTLPLVINLFNMGSSGTPGGKFQNNILQAFLDSDQDKDVDMGDVLHFANRFLNPPR